eukprot:scaffold242063_cov42-Prasinocladus_malaysianus.AAC.1
MRRLCCSSTDNGRASAGLKARDTPPGKDPGGIERSRRACVDTSLLSSPAATSVGSSGDWASGGTVQGTVCAEGEEGASSSYASWFLPCSNACASDRCSLLAADSKPTARMERTEMSAWRYEIA